MFAVVVEIELHAGVSETFMPLMHENAKASLSGEPACQRFDVCTNPDQPDQVFLYELYDDAAAFDVHLKMPHFLHFDQATAAMIKSKQARMFSEVSS